MACVSVSAFSGGLIDAAKAEKVMDTLRTLTEESQQVSRMGCWCFGGDECVSSCLMRGFIDQLVVFDIRFSAMLCKSL